MTDSHPQDRLTFKVEGARITAARFKAQFDAFLDMANEVADSVADKRQSVDWIVSVEPGSVVVHIDAEPKRIEPSIIPYAVSAIKKGIQSLESGTEEWPEHFTEKALTSMRKIADVLAKSNGELSHVKIGYNGSSKNVTTRSLATVDSLLTGKYTDYGTVEGTIRVLDGRKKVRFAIDDDLTGRSISCYFSKELWDSVHEVFDPWEPPRVSVSGLILYRSNGQPVSIQADNLRAFQAKEKLPSWGDMLGFLE